ncbi:MAG: alpha-ketoacid dehydrogenase subunit beta [Gammaproteobacteria bacterium]|nr:alpha-ketoacid dehydrogenase subunit beta [Gammaproteobacteria bacterium]
MSARTLTYGAAIGEALAEELARDERVVLFGEDVEIHGGIFGVLRGLRQQFGARVFDTPIAENLIAGMAVGAAARGLRPVAELQFADFVLCAADEVLLKAGGWRYTHDGAYTLPLVIRAPSGGYGFGPEHSQCPEAYVMHTPGLRLAVPSSPADVKGLLKSAIRSDDPVVLFEHKLLYPMKGEVPDGEHLVPFGQAAVRRAGDALTVVAWQDMLRRTLKAAETLAAEGIEIEVIDPRTLNPFDWDTLLTSVKKTGGCLVVEEAFRTLGVGAEIGARLMEDAFGYLDRPFKRLAIPDVPVPTAKHLVDQLVPSAETIAATVRGVLA